MNNDSMGIENLFYTWSDDFFQLLLTKIISQKYKEYGLCFRKKDDIIIKLADVFSILKLPQGRILMKYLKRGSEEMSDKTILEQWRAIAYDQQADRNKLQRFWANYFNIEKGIYEQLLTNPDEVVTGTVKELAEKYGQDVLTMVGFLDGINDSLKVPNPIETMDEDTKVSLCFDKELLYKNMVDAKADWLYELPQWDAIFTAEKRKELYLEQKKSGTIVKPHKVGRNDPCPCGSGKKYKHCCGR